MSDTPSDDPKKARLHSQSKRDLFKEKMNPDTGSVPGGMDFQGFFERPEEIRPNPLQPVAKAMLGQQASGKALSSADMQRLNRAAIDVFKELGITGYKEKDIRAAKPKNEHDTSAMRDTTNMALFIAYRDTVRNLFPEFDPEKNSTAAFDDMKLTDRLYTHNTLKRMQSLLMTMIGDWSQAVNIHMQRALTECEICLQRYALSPQQRTP